MAKGGVKSVTLEAGDKSVTLTGEQFDKATGEILGKDGAQLSLFDGHRVNLIQNSIKGGEIVVFNEGGRFKDVLKFGDKVRLEAVFEVVKVMHGRDSNGALVRQQVLSASFADFKGFEGGLID
jgi:hypothetical protein